MIYDKSPRPRPGRPGISYEDVETVVNAILARGGKPTHTAVKAELGTGSTKKLGEHMQLFWRNYAAAREASQPSLSAHLLASIRQEIATTAGALTADLATQLSVAEADRTALLQEVGELTDEVERGHGEVKALEAAVASRDGALAELRGRLHQADERERAFHKEIQQLGVELNAARQGCTHGDLVDRIVATINQRVTQGKNAVAPQAAHSSSHDGKYGAGAKPRSPEPPSERIIEPATAAGVDATPSPAVPPDVGDESSAPTLRVAKPGVLTITRDLIREKGVVSTKEIEAALRRSGLILNSSTLTNLASTLSQAKDLVYSRQQRGWTSRDPGDTDQQDPKSR